MYLNVSSDEETALILDQQATLKSYQTVEVDGKNGLEFSSTVTNKQRSFSWILIISLLVVSALTLTSIVGFTKTRSNMYSSTEETRFCSFAECQRNMCPLTAPFVCVSGILYVM